MICQAAKSRKLVINQSTRKIDSMMSHIRICFFTFLVFSITIQFGICDNNTDCDQKRAPGSDKTHLTFIDRILSIKGVLGLGISDKSSSNSKNIFNQIHEEIKLIFPGTYWCGDGDRAKGNEDKLGAFKKTDACCREHDKCESNIEANQIKLNLKNNGYFTRSACICDEKFYNCLKKANNLLAYKIGKIYFNFVGMQCFTCECPPKNNYLINDNTECERYKWLNNSQY